MINKETGNRLKQQMVDAETGDVVESDQKGRGYELTKGEYVEIEKDELEAVQIESNHTIDIDSFVPRDEIDKRYLNHPYYIAPDGKAGIDAFAVIRDAMKDQDRVALARIVLTNREHVIAIEPLGKGLLGTTLRYPYELRDEDEYFDDIKSPKISKDMVELASHILDTKAAHFDPSKFKDEYENALKTLVRRKAAGKPVKAAEREEKPDNVISLMDALKQSLKRKVAKASAKRTPTPRPDARRIVPRRRRTARPRGRARRGEPDSIFKQHRFTYSRHTPRKRSIRYAADCVSISDARDTGSPAFAGHDDISGQPAIKPLLLRLPLLRSSFSSLLSSAPSCLRPSPRKARSRSPACGS